MKQLVWLLLAASCGFNRVGGPGDLQATPDDLSGGEHAHAATHLAFVTQPKTAAVDAPIGPVKVAALDDQDHVAADFDGPIYLRLTANAAELTLRGDSLLPAQAGVVSFDDLSLDGTGQALALSANARSLGAAASDSFDVTAAAWLPANAGLEGAPVRRVVVDPTDSSTVFAATAGAGLFVTHDSGASWASANIALADRRITELAVNGAGALFAATLTGLYQRQHGAGAWELVDLGDGFRQLPVGAVAAHDATLYVACNGRILSSGDAGATWSAAPADGDTAAALHLAISPSDDLTLFASDGTTVVKSTDGASHFGRSDTGLPAATVRDLVFDAAGALYASTDQGAYRLAPGGTQWSRLASGAGAASSVSASPTETDTVYVSDQAAGLYRVSGGVATLVITAPHPAPSALAIAPSTPLFAYLGSDGGGVSRDSLAGGVWSAGSGQTAARVHSLATDPAGTLLAATDGGLYRSTDRAVHFSAVTPGAEPRFDAVAFAGATAYALARGTAWSSSDGGASFAAASGFDGCAQLVFDPADATTAYCSPSDGNVAGVYRIAMSGQSRMLLAGGLPSHVSALAIDPASSGATAIVWAATPTGLFRSGDAGSSFAAATPASAFITALAVGAKVVCATAAGAFTSSDGGASWQSLDARLAGATLFAFDAQAGLYAVAGGLFRSTDGGASFSTAGSGLHDATVSALAFDPTTPLSIYAGTAGAGLFGSISGGQ